ncbi:MAG: helix-turn-helix transcriptional regulator [Eubacteriales bacterium]|nr:helix-turn-helix transcriptional regulator [Eubacteriales bacterium]
MALWTRLKEKLRKEPKGESDHTQRVRQAGLTPRELDVLRLLLQGCTLQQSADRLGMKYSTANTHMTAIYRKLGVTSRAALIIRYHDFEKETEK